MQFALAQFVWRAPGPQGTGWYPPLFWAEHLDTVDIRSLTAQATPGVNDGDLGGWALMAFTDGAVLPPTAISLGSDALVDTILQASAILAIKNATGLQIVGPSVTTRSAMLRFLTSLADATGVNAVPPLPKGATMWLGGMRIGTA